MKKFLIFIICIFMIPFFVNAGIICNDGHSSSCSDCHQGCCSRHGGCTPGGPVVGGGGNNNNYVPATPVATPTPTPIPKSEDTSLKEVLLDGKSLEISTLMEEI